MHVLTIPNQALIPITIIFKLVLTRWYDFHMDAADAAYADVISGQAVPTNESAEGATDERENHAGRRSRRHTVNTRLKSVKLPELSLRATLNFPLAGRSTLKAKHGPQAVLQRLTQHLRDSGAYSELQDVVARDITTTRQEATEQAVKDLAVPSAEKTLEALENPGASEQNADPSLRASSTSEYHAKALPHPKLRRDDRPDPSAPYIDPYLTEPLERYLWLPRDPLFPIDLDDTIGAYMAAGLAESIVHRTTKRVSSLQIGTAERSSLQKVALAWSAVGYRRRITKEKNLHCCLVLWWNHPLMSLNRWKQSTTHRALAQWHCHPPRAYLPLLRSRHFSAGHLACTLVQSVYAFRKNSNLATLWHPLMMVLL